MSNEFFKTLKLNIDYTGTESLKKLGSGIQHAFENSSIGKVLADGFNAAITGQNPLKVMFDSFIESFGKTLNSAIDRLGEMVNYSQMTDANIRDLKLGYGFSSSQAYGYQTALDVMGFSNMEDLMYASNEQLELFNKAFNKYSEYYESTMTPEYIQQQLEYQAEMEMFKLDVQHELIEFFMNNKDTIMNAMKATIKVGEYIIYALDWLIDFFSEDKDRTQEERTRETQTILSSYQTSNNQTNVNVSNSFTNIQKEDTSWLANAGSMTYKQLIEALK